MKKALTIIAGIVVLIGAQTTLAQDCDLTITGNDAMQFNLTELSVSNSCSEVTLTIAHVGNLPAASMGHNWVLTELDDMQAVASDGISAGIDNRYLKADDSRILAATDIIGGGEETTVTFTLAGLTVGKDYAFFCSFPGHWALMKGIFKIEE